MALFEKVSKYVDQEIKMPKRKTEFSAGYDMVAAEDYVIPSVWQIHPLSYHHPCRHQEQSLHAQRSSALFAP